MNERNTPGVGRVLAHHGLVEIPEAHCYLMHDGARIDITRDIPASTEAIAALLYEETITPPQVGLYKANVHQEFLQNWLQNMEFGRTWTSDDLWRVREDCIAALAAPLLAHALTSEDLGYVKYLTRVHSRFPKRHRCRPPKNKWKKWLLWRDASPATPKSKV